MYKYIYITVYLQEEVVEWHTRHLGSDGGGQPPELRSGVERPVLALRRAAGAAAALAARGEWSPPTAQITGVVLLVRRAFSQLDFYQR